MNTEQRYEGSRRPSVERAVASHAKRSDEGRRAAEELASRELRAASLLAGLGAEADTRDLASAFADVGTPVLLARLRLERELRLTERTVAMVGAAQRDLDGLFELVADGTPPRAELVLAAESSLAEAHALHRHARERLDDALALGRRAAQTFDAQLEALRAALHARSERTGRPSVAGLVGAA
jgi:hypothetical protein